MPWSVLIARMSFRWVLDDQPAQYCFCLFNMPHSASFALQFGEFVPRDRSAPNGPLIDLGMRVVVVGSLFLFGVPHWIRIHFPTILIKHRNWYAICTRPNS